MVISAKTDMSVNLSPKQFTQTFVSNYSQITNTTVLTLGTMKASSPTITTIVAIEYTRAALATVAGQEQFCGALRDAMSTASVKSNITVPAELMLSTLTCPAMSSTVIASCAEGFTGTLCARCDDTYLRKVARNGRVECELCAPISSASIRTVYVLAGFMLLLLLNLKRVLRTLAKCCCRKKWLDRWRMWLQESVGERVISARVRLRKSKSYVKILIGLGQVVSLMGPALQLTWKPTFETLLAFLKLLTNIDILGFLGPLPSVRLCLISGLEHHICGTSFRSITGLREPNSTKRGGARDHTLHDMHART